MIEKILEAVGEALKHLYPDIERLNYYPDSDFKNESFVVTSTGGSYKKRISTEDITRGFNNINVNVTYFSRDALKLNTVSEDLKLRIEVLETKDGDKFRIYNKRNSVNISDNHASFTFTVRVSMSMGEDPNPRMQSLNFQDELKR